MLRNSQIFVVLGLLLFASTTVAQTEIPTKITDWKEYPFPEEPEFWRWLNPSEYDWLVVKDGDEIRVSNHLDNPNNRTTDTVYVEIPLGETWIGLPLRDNSDTVQINSGGKILSAPRTGLDAETPDGFFISLSRGEWGGEVWFFPKNLTPGYRVSRDQLHAVYRLDGRLFGFDGLAHRGLDEGKIVEYRRSELGRWKSHLVQNLPGSPEAMLQLDDGSCLVVANQGIGIFRPGKGLEIIFDELHFGGTYPSTAVEDKFGNIFIGLRHVVVKLTGLRDKSEPKLSVLVPNASFIEERLAEAKEAAAERELKASLFYTLSRINPRDCILPALFLLCMLAATVLGVLLLRKKIELGRR